jgi:chemotaxis protein CheD
MGADRRRLLAKVFGGARVLAGLETLDVGAKNSEFVLSFLQVEGIQIVAQDLLGVCPRKLHFYPATGKVQLKKLKLPPNDIVHRREREYLSHLADKTDGGEIEIFSAPR